MQRQIKFSIISRGHFHVKRYVGQDFLRTKQNQNQKEKQKQNKNENENKQKTICSNYHDKFVQKLFIKSINQKLKNPMFVVCSSHYKKYQILTKDKMPNLCTTDMNVLEG